MQRTEQYRAPRTRRSIGTRSLQTVQIIDPCIHIVYHVRQVARRGKGVSHEHTPRARERRVVTNAVALRGDSASSVFPQQSVQIWRSHLIVRLADAPMQIWDGTFTDSLWSRYVVLPIMPSRVKAGFWGAYYCAKNARLAISQHIAWVSA